MTFICIHTLIAEYEYTKCSLCADGIITQWAMFTTCLAKIRAASATCMHSSSHTYSFHCHSQPPQLLADIECLLQNSSRGLVRCVRCLHTVTRRAAKLEQAHTHTSMFFLHQALRLILSLRNNWPCCPKSPNLVCHRPVTHSLRVYLLLQSSSIMKRVHAYAHQP